MRKHVQYITHARTRGSWIENLFLIILFLKSVTIHALLWKTTYFMTRRWQIMNLQHDIFHVASSPNKTVISYGTWKEKQQEGRGNSARSGFLFTRINYSYSATHLVYSKHYWPTRIRNFFVRFTTRILPSLPLLFRPCSWRCPASLRFLH